MITLIDKYKPLIEADESVRYYIITGGRGSSKSFSVNSLATFLTFEQGHRILFTRYTMSSAHLSIIPEFLEKIDITGTHKYFKVNRQDIQNLTSKSDILFRGIKTSSGEQTANLKSLKGVTTWILDEAEELTDQSTFDKIDLSVRVKGKHNRVILILNPSTKEHWIYKEFFEKRGVNAGFNGIKGDTCYIHTTYLDNIKNLNQGYINKLNAMKEHNPKKYDHVVLGGWLDKIEGAIFSNWEVGEFDDTLDYSFGQDFGFSVDPTTLDKVAIDKKKKIIYVKECCHKSHMTTSDIANVNKKHAERKLIIADSAEPRLIQELKSRGLNIHATEKGQGSVSAGIALMQDYKIVVDPDSTNIISELNNYAWDLKKDKVPIDMYNHHIDAIRYNVFYHLSNPNRGKYDIHVI